REAYEAFLGSEEMKSIMNGKRQALYGIDILRKISNHPDLQDHKVLSRKPGYNYGSGSKSGKMQVVKALLEIWRKNGHKTLLFAQHRIMLDILEKFIRELGGFNYRRMDGNTSIKDRQSLVDEFNNNPDLHVFLLTTKVGGLGVNLTGADRVIIYDPDWNPSTDVQARERAWRLGQKREVEIYRLMTAGTIEEKIYHRQIFKQFLTNKILRDPKQRQTFQLKDLHDLFTLGEANDTQTETGSLFKGTEVQFKDRSTPNTGTGIPTPPTENDKHDSKLAAITG
ncbi:DNA repair protein rhp26, partial [Cryomyces antarcticus]